MALAKLKQLTIRTRNRVTNRPPSPVPRDRKRRANGSRSDTESGTAPLAWTTGGICSVRARWVSDLWTLLRTPPTSDHSHGVQPALREGAEGALRLLLFSTSPRGTVSLSNVQQSTRSLPHLCYRFGTAVRVASRLRANLSRGFARAIPVRCRAAFPGGVGVGVVRSCRQCMDGIGRWNGHCRVACRRPLCIRCCRRISTLRLHQSG